MVCAFICFRIRFGMVVEALPQRAVHCKVCIDENWLVFCSWILSEFSLELFFRLFLLCFLHSTFYSVHQVPAVRYETFTEQLWNKLTHIFIAEAMKNVAGWYCDSVTCLWKCVTVPCRAHFQASEDTFLSACITYKCSGSFTEESSIGNLVIAWYLSSLCRQLTWNVFSLDYWRV